MQKKKVKIIISIQKLIARTWIINIPAVFILMVLMLMEKLSWISALVALLCFWGVSAFIIFFIFKDLDDFIAYLNKVAEGMGEELPKFKKSLFSSQRLANAYQSVLSLWQKQALSDTSILENLPDPLLMTNMENKIVFMNQSAQKLFGNNALNQDIFALFKITPFYPSLKFFKFEIQKKQKLYYSVRSDTLPYPTRLGGVRTFLLHDMTQFEEFHRQQTDFFANASHELKTPLAILSGAIETLQGPAQKDKKAQQHFLNMMAEQTRHMTLLVQDFLNLARLQQESHRIKKEIVLSDFITDLMMSFQQKIQEKHQSIFFENQTQTLTWQGNISDLKYICQNLLDNAVKYAPQKARITLTLLSTQKNFSLRVHNTGTYIPPQEQSKIFERFYRLNTPKKPEGSGLGLNIVSFLVKKYCGQIQVKSTKKSGTTFILTLPLSS